MVIPELNNVSYVMIDVEWNTDVYAVNNGFYDDTEQLNITINFFFNKNDLLKYKLFNPHNATFDKHILALSRFEWEHMLPVTITSFMLNGMFIIPFSLWTLMIKLIPGSEYNKQVEDMFSFSRYFENDMESQNKIMEFHKSFLDDKHPLVDFFNRFKIIN